MRLLAAYAIALAVHGEQTGRVEIYNDPFTASVLGQQLRYGLQDMARVSDGLDLDRLWIAWMDDFKKIHAAPVG